MQINNILMSSAVAQQMGDFRSACEGYRLMNGMLREKMQLEEMCDNRAGAFGTLTTLRQNERLIANNCRS
jgi:hypothetical protein